MYGKQQGKMKTLIAFTKTHEKIRIVIEPLNIADSFQSVYDDDIQPERNTGKQNKFIIEIAFAVEQKPVQ